MKKLGQTKAEEAVFDVVMGILGLRGGDETEELTITIPQRLFFLSSTQENGNEYLLEGEEIVINATRRNETAKGKRILKVIISEEFSSLDELLHHTKRKRISAIKNEGFYVDYRIIRNVLLDLILYLEPISLNFITK